MKRQYSKPNMSVEVFEANEYIASCVEIRCRKPSIGGVYYLEGDKTVGTDGYQEGFRKKDTALDACGANGNESGTCGKKFVIKRDSFKTSDNLFYDSNGIGSNNAPFAYTTKAYYFTEEDGTYHYFTNWTETNTNSSI